MPRIVAVNAAAPDAGVIAEAAAALRAGGLVAFPTETVYGLGARGLHAAEVERIFTAKGRPAGHPLILHVDGEAMARSLAAEWNEHAAKLAAAFWPGPLTLVVPRAAHVPREVSGGLDTVGLRAPAHAVARALISAVGEPLAAPSANAHTHVSPTTAEHVARSLGDRVDLVLDAGPCEHGIESTVVAVGTNDTPARVLRPGAVTLAQLRAVDPTILDGTTTLASDAPRAAPGMAAKHYAPRTRVVLAARGDVGYTLAEATIPAATNSFRAAAIVATTSGQSDAAGCDPLIVLPDDPVGYAHGLYAALHDVDAAGVDLLVVEAPPADQESWAAVTDRLRRAAKA